MLHNYSFNTMNEHPAKSEHNSALSVERREINDLEQRIDPLLERLHKDGIDMQRWDDEYMALPEDAEALDNFLKRLQLFVEQREDALLAFEFSEGHTEQEKEQIKRFDRDVRAAFRDPSGFLGNGATAEVYGMPSNNTICVKFIISQERYNENNHLRREFNYLSKVFECTRGQAVTTPYPIFLRIHAKEGHSYGMERIQGASLSQILEQADKYPELVTLAKSIDRQQAESDLVAFVENMHEANVVHGDLYHRNIMLDGEGRLVVIDFGKAHQIDFEGGKTDDRKLDEYTAVQSLRDFFRQIDLLTNNPNSV